MKLIHSLFKISLLAALFSISYNVHAEYYIVYPAAGTYYVEPAYTASCCAARYVEPCCYATPIVYIRSSAPYRYGDASAGTAEYAWISEDPYRY